MKNVNELDTNNRWNILTPDCCNDCRKMFDAFIERLAERMRVTPCKEDLRNARQTLQEMQEELKDEQIDVHGTLRHLRDDLGMMCDGAIVENFYEGSNYAPYQTRTQMGELAKDLGQGEPQGIILSPDLLLLDQPNPYQAIWDHFIEQLIERIKETPCDNDFTQAREVLEEMNKRGENINIEETLADMEAHGGYCDCEILMNVVWGYDWMFGDMISQPDF
jgi:hypothetical protein